MYKSHSIWDEEKDKYEHSTGKPEKGADYHNKADYAAGEHGSSDVYNTAKKEDDKHKKDKSEFERQVDDNLPQKKYEKKENEDDVIRAKAAEEIRKGMDAEKTKVNKTSSTSKSIEDAIKKAIKEEKEVIRL